MLNLKGKQFVFDSEDKSLLIISNWDSKTKEFIGLKNKLKKHFDFNQSSCCAYCGNKMGVTSRPEIEHIAPKGDSLYPQFKFEALNLLFACELCNGSSMKGAKDVVSLCAKNYSDCEFYLVHPYFDDPKDHFDWTDEHEVIITSKSEKGKYSITLFELDGPARTEARQEKYDLKQFKLSKENEKLIKEAIQK